MCQQLITSFKLILIAMTVFTQLNISIDHIKRKTSISFSVTVKSDYFVLTLLYKHTEGHKVMYTSTKFHTKTFPC